MAVYDNDTYVKIKGKKYVKSCGFCIFSEKKGNNICFCTANHGSTHCRLKKIYVCSVFNACQSFTFDMNKQIID